jgi:hypothetical protein
MEQFDLYLQYQKDVAEAKLKVIERFQQGVKAKPKKRTSKIDTVHHVLNQAGQPLHVSDIMEIALRDFQIQLDRDSIVSGIIKKVKADKTFIRTAPNTFGLKAYASN